MTLTKSDYVLYLKHPAWLWLKKFDKNKLPEIDENTQAIFDAGHEFEQYVEKLFPNGVKLGFTNYQEYLELPLQTKKALKSGATTIFQGQFEVNNLTCIVDILDKVSDNTFDLIEIKSSTKVKPEHLYDLAFQTVVLQDSGFTIRDIFVIHVNNKYVRYGEINPVELTTKVNVTDDVKNLLNLTREQINNALEILKSKELPDPSPRYVNNLEIPYTEWFKDWLKIYKTLFSNLDKYSIYNLVSLDKNQVAELEDAKVELIKDIPETTNLKFKQRYQVKTTRDNKRFIDKKKIREFIDTFEFPLYFFDYETFSSIIPFFDGLQPYSDYPFQYSLHILDKSDGELKHAEYIHDKNSNPMPDLIKKLKNDVGSKGTVLTWNMTYEKNCNNRMAELYPEHKEFLEDLNNRINDLMTPFSKLWFVDKDFFGSASVKNVLPVLVPELSYKELNVSDGLLARRVWTETVLREKNENNKEQIMKDLSMYCTLDTYAMVRILEVLKDLVY